MLNNKPLFQVGPLDQGWWLDGLREFHWVKPVSILEKHRSALEPEFRERPPHSVAEAMQRIEAMTGVCRKETQVRAFLKKVLA